MCSYVSLSILCIFIINYVQPATVIQNATTENVDFDDFIPFTHSSLKDPFDWKLLQKFSSSRGHRNVIISPLSLKIVLALLYEGSGGNTEKEFQNILNFPVDKKTLRDQYSHLLDVLERERRDYIINLGTRIFLDSNLTAQQPYMAKALDSYRTKIVSTNFSNPQEASNNINLWVEYLTNGRIKKLVNPDDIEDAVLLLTNVIYFKGLWRHPFPEKRSFYGGFYLNPSESITVQYMSNIEKYFHVESKTLNAQILRLPYKGRKFSMFIILPNSKSGLPSLLERLNHKDLKMAIHIMDEITVEVILPKFRFDFQTRYSNILYDLGLTTMFQSVASFPGIVRGQNSKLVVTDIVQKAGIDVNEEGSESYVATDVQIGNKFREPEVIFNASHPFIFFIEEQNTSTILFVGKVENPLEIDAMPLPPRFGEGHGSSSDTSKVPLPEAAQPPQLPSKQPPTFLEDESNKNFNNFAVTLLKNANPHENVFISPASIISTLGLILEGSVGESAEEIVRSLQLPSVVSKRRWLFQRLVTALTDNSHSTILESSNGVFVSNKYQVIPEYQRIVEQYFRAFLKSVNFHNVAQAANEINSFVGNFTRGLIPEIISPARLSEDTSIVLTNALYFKAYWLNSFDDQATSVKCFYSPRKGCINTYMMHTVSKYRYLQTDQTQFLELPYSDGKHAMLIIVEKESRDPRQFLANFQHISFSALLARLELTEVQLRMPRFAIDFSIELVPILKSTGIKSVFESNANLSAMINENNIHVDTVLHKAKIEVNEKGTIAAAATGAVVIPLMGTTNPKVNADHPFIFFIYKIETGDILFEGILNEPIEVPKSSSMPTERPILQPFNPMYNQLHPQPLQEPAGSKSRSRQVVF